jgi:hypothetical protein
VRNSGTKTISPVLNVTCLPKLSNFCVPPIMRPIRWSHLSPSNPPKESGRQEKEEIVYFWKTIRLFVSRISISEPRNFQTLAPRKPSAQPKKFVKTFSARNKVFSPILRLVFFHNQHPRHLPLQCVSTACFSHFRSSNRRERGTARTAPKKRAAVGGHGNTQRPRVRVREVAGYAGDPAGPSLCGGPVAAFVRNTHSPRAPPDPAPAKTQAWRQRARLRLRTKPLAAWHPPPCMGLRRAWQRKQHRTQRRGPRMVTPLWRRPARARRSVPEATCASESESAGHHQLWPAPCAQWLQSRSL